MKHESDWKPRRVESSRLVV